MNYKQINKMIDELLDQGKADPMGEFIPGDHYREIIWESGLLENFKGL